MDREDIINSMRKRIRIIFTGGTIAGNVAQRENALNEKADPNSFYTILDNAAEVVSKTWHIEVERTTVELLNKDSSNIVPSDWTKLIDEIVASYDDHDAFIILHGTNTMGYTAAALSFALPNINKPVIITGAQVPLGYLGSDATTNIVNALRMAVWTHHEAKGVMAVFGSKIITGTRVKKGTDFDYDPFSSFQSGSLGQIGRFMKIDEKALEKHVDYLSKYYPVAEKAAELRVSKVFKCEDLVSLTEFPGLSADYISKEADAGAKGFILRSFGAGDPNSQLFEAFEYLKERKIPIIVTTQAPGGNSNFQVNETGQYLREHDLAIPAHDMSIEAMTTKMAWLLGQDADYETIKEKLVEDMRGEVNVGAELI
jgi:L-asparaginase